MASSTKYQQAPTADPDDYTSAPPAYAAGPSSRDESQGLFAAPRSSEDNLPDDFKVCLRTLYIIVEYTANNTSLVAR